MTHDEATREARGIWGKGAEVRVITGGSGFQSCEIRLYDHPRTHGWYSIKGVGPTPEKAFVDADRKSVSGSPEPLEGKP